MHKPSAISAELSEKVLREIPVIGVLTNPRKYGEFNTYVMGAYVKFIEQAGGKVVPIHHTDSDEEIEAQLDKINGVVLPGGAVPIFDENGELSFYSKKVKVILEKTKELNERGVHFPIWAICLGFQVIAGIEAPYNDTVALNAFDAVDTSDRVVFKVDPTVSRMYRSIPENLLNAIQSEGITYNSHHDGVYPSVFDKYASLKNNYHIVTTSTDRQGVEYVASFEHKRYPIYSLQYHPEKIQFIFKEGLNIPRTENTIDLAKYYADFFVSECKLNGNHYSSAEEEASNYINLAPVMHTGTVSQDIYGFVEPL